MDIQVKVYFIVIYVKWCLSYHLNQNLRTKIQFCVV